MAHHVKFSVVMCKPAAGSGAACCRLPADTHHLLVHGALFYIYYGACLHQRDPSDCMVNEMPYDYRSTRQYQALLPCRWPFTNSVM